MKKLKSNMPDEVKAWMSIGSGIFSSSIGGYYHDFSIGLITLGACMLFIGILMVMCGTRIVEEP